MSSSESNERQVVSSNGSDAGDDGVVHVNTITVPYQYEPLAEGLTDDEEEGRARIAEEADEDGLSLAAIERRFERVENVNEWCKCGKCSVQNLVGARKYRCCWEVHPAFGKLTFDGSVDRIKCVTLHDEYIALSNRIVLKQVGPLLKDRQGRGYRRRGNQTENEYARAVAYRWLVRWIFGPMGWDNTRPLPACIYEEIRSRFPTTSLRGYATTEEHD